MLQDMGAYLQYNPACLCQLEFLEKLVWFAWSVFLWPKLVFKSIYWFIWLCIQYEDDEGDRVLLTTDSDLANAVSNAKSLGQKVISLFSWILQISSCHYIKF